MDATEPEDSREEMATTRIGKRGARKVVSHDEPSPHDGLTGRESEDALLEAIMPTLPKQGLSVRSSSFFSPFLSYFP